MRCSWLRAARRIATTTQRWPVPDLAEISSLEGLDEYLALFAPYEEQLSKFEGPQREYGGRFALLFKQVVRLLVRDQPINALMPRMFPSMAQRYLDREQTTLQHFSYEDNRHFFLSELLEWLTIRERGRVRP